MADHATPHFHNQPGLPSIKVRVKEFMCIGALPPFDHPHIYIDMGSDTEAICSYCSTRFVFDAGLKTACDPAECEAALTGAA
ncbi:MAG: zinc-finger domain-containing protein [Beijerinckiaceae bacterium]